MLRCQQQWSSMDTSMDTQWTSERVASCFAMMSLLHSIQTQRRLAFLRAAMHRRRMEFVAELERSRRSYRRRRRASVASIVALADSALPNVRHTWVRERAQCFWSTVEKFDDNEWKSHFRMSRATFEYLVGLVAPVITKRTTNFRRPIEPRRRVAIALWWLATPGEYRTIACLFGVGLSTVCCLVRQVTSALVTTLYERFISLPTGQRLEETIAGFGERGYPQCAGAIDGTHIPIITPREKLADYYNKKGWYSIVLQAVVDHNLCFTDVYAGSPGRAHGARVLANSDLYVAAEDRGYLFPIEKSKMVDGIEIPVHLIGDAAYPLRRWLMKGFSQQQSEEQARYTEALSSAQMVVSTAFDRLKGRWRCLLKRNDVDLAVMPSIVAACCILHNICEVQKDSFLPEWIPAVDENLTQPHSAVRETVGSDGAQVIRDTIACHLTEMLSDKTLVGVK